MTKSIMNKFLKSTLFLGLLTVPFLSANAQTTVKAVPIFENGETQIVPEFKDADKWIRTDLWVETPFDTDGDGKKDRMHVDVTRPYQTETEGLKLPVIYESSPYYSGVAPDVEGGFWDVNHELGQAGKARVHAEVLELVNVRLYQTHSLQHGYLVVLSWSTPRRRVLVYRKVPPLWEVKMNL